MIRANRRLAARLCPRHNRSTTLPPWPPVASALFWFALAAVASGQISYVPQDAQLAGSCPDCGTTYEESLSQALYIGPGGQDPTAYVEQPYHPLRERLQQILHPPGRHRGLGHPLQRESWLFRPFGAGWFAGVAQGGRAIEDHPGIGNLFSGGVGMKRGYIGGYRLGWDSSYYWGAELRMAFASVELFDSPAARAAQQVADADESDSWRNRFDQRRDASLQQWDANLVYYPWGDSQWRPYLTVGLGTQRVRLYDRINNHYDSFMFTLPLAVGLKYRCNDRLALRFDVTDNIAFGGGSAFGALHTLAATAGVEVRFGGTRKAYWPWNPGRHYW